MCPARATPKKPVECGDEGKAFATSGRLRSSSRSGGGPSTMTLCTGVRLTIQPCTGNACCRGSASGCSRWALRPALSVSVTARTILCPGRYALRNLSCRQDRQPRGLETPRSPGCTRAGGSTDHVPERLKLASIIGKATTRSDSSHCREPLLLVPLRKGVLHPGPSRARRAKIRSSLETRSQTRDAVLDDVDACERLAIERSFPLGAERGHAEREGQHLRKLGYESSALVDVVFGLTGEAEHQVKLHPVHTVLFRALGGGKVVALSASPLDQAAEPLACAVGRGRQGAVAGEVQGMDELLL